jgi:hypothetical protein
MADGAFGHESSAVAVGRIAAVAALCAVALSLTVVGVCLVLRLRLEPEQVIRREGVPALPAPRLQARPRIDLAALRLEKQAALESYGWADSTRQFAHIPLERAMAIYAQSHGGPAETLQGTHTDGKGGP